MTCKYSKTLATSKSKTQSATTQKINTNHHSSFLSLTDMTSRRNPLIYALYQLTILWDIMNVENARTRSETWSCICANNDNKSQWLKPMFVRVLLCVSKRMNLKTLLRMNLKKKEIFVEINQQIRALSWTYTGFKCNLSRKKELQAKKES